MKIKYWEYNVLGLNHPESPKLIFICKFLKDNFNKLEGDYVEIGVYTGKSLITITNLFAELETTKVRKVAWGYDTFEGFPKELRQDKRDAPTEFKRQLDEGIINKDQMVDIERLLRLRNFINKSNASTLTHQELASSKNFDGERILETIEEKMAFMELTNYKLIKGNITKTLKEEKYLPEKIFCALIDVDLYQSYEASLVQIWPRVVKGGVVFLDEYYSLKYPGAREYVNYFVKNNSNAELRMIGISGDFERWALIKTEEARY